MAIQFPSDYWVEIPGGRYTVGLRPEEARLLAEQSAAWKNHVGPEASVHDWKNLIRGMELVDQTGNVEWMTQFLLERYPARDIELSSFAIARRPILNREYKQFIAETGEFEPYNWQGGPAPDELPAKGISWEAAVAFARWAGARLPFDAEWERAMRAPDRRLFPWGNVFRPLGEMAVRENESDVPLSAARSNPIGLLGGLEDGCEWCADLWEQDDVRLNDDDPRLPRGDASHRIVRGPLARNRREIPSLVGRSSRRAFEYATPNVQIRLVRPDARTIPASRPPSRNDAATLEVRAFERDVLRPVFASVRTAKAFELYDTLVVSDGFYQCSEAIQNVVTELRGDSTDVFRGFWANADTVGYWAGSSFIAASRETMRRHPPEHGIYAWGIDYRISAHGSVRARPVVAYRMAFNKKLHRFIHRFRPDEVDTVLTELTPDLIKRHFWDSFRFFELHADDDQSPF